jgi:competence protein ComEA
VYDAKWVQAARGWSYRHAPQLALSLGAVLVVALAILFITWPRPALVAARAAPQAAARVEHALVMVYVSGAVMTPGIYRLDAGLRVRDAIENAGGITPEADTDHLPNLAARLRDGHEIHVPTHRAARARGGATRKLDLNSATEAELARVPGIDPQLAAAIVAQRDAYGAFQRLSELKSAVGIDERLFRELRRYLAVE